jgi:hypothetical protein
MRDVAGWLKWAIGAVAAALVAGLVLLAVHHSGHSAPPAHSATKATTTKASTTTTLKTELTSPHFGTPQAAMTYLAAAWNDNNIVDLDHVTNPAARAQLSAMHSMAVNLALQSCTRNPPGDYTCTFTHNYPPNYKGGKPGHGHAVFLVGPALTPGWYMTVYESCN